MTKLFTLKGNRYGFAIVALLIALAMPAYAENVKVGNLWYSLDNASKTATVVSHADYADYTSVVIPGTVSYENVDYSVTALAQQAFDRRTSLVSVTMPDELKTIGKWAFYGCTGLTDVTIPAGVDSIAASAFSKCSGLMSLTFSGNGKLRVIGDWAFGTCNRLMAVSIPSSVKTIGSCAFSECSSLTTVLLSEGLEKIDVQAFYMCAITQIKLPSTLVRIEGSAFSQCQKLESINIPEKVTEIAAQTFYKCLNLKTVTFEGDVKSIGNGAFYECTSLNISKLPDAVSFIDNSAFQNCKSITSFTIPPKITQLSNSAFNGCNALTTINMHDDITDLGKSLFYGCTKLNNVVIPGKVTVIPDQLFSSCTSLSNVTIPEDVTTVGNNAFAACTSLTKANITAKMTSISSSAYSGCTSLTGFEVAEGNPAYTAVDGVLYDKDVTKIVLYPSGRQGKLKLPSTVTEIPAYSLNRSTLTEIELPAGLKTIGDGAFGMSSLSVVPDLPEGLESIGVSAFAMCTGMKGVLKLPNSLKYVGNTAFMYCLGVSGLVLPNSGDVVLGENAFSGNAFTSVVFPEGFANIGAYDISKPYTVMGTESSLKYIVFPSTLTTLCPFGNTSTQLSAIYCFANVPPVLVGGAATMPNIAVVRVPKGTAAAYETAWGNVMPNAEFLDVLPVKPVVSSAKYQMAIDWEVYVAKGYDATPVSYDLTISSGDDIRVFKLDAAGQPDGSASAAPADGKLHFWIGDLPVGTYNYDLKGYSALGELMLSDNGSVEVGSTSIDAVDTAAGDMVSVDGNRVSVAAEARVYSMTGALVAVVSDSVTLPSGLYVVVVNGHAVKIRI